MGQHAEETGDGQTGEYGPALEHDQRHSGPRSDGPLHSNVPVGAQLIEGVRFAEGEYGHQGGAATQEAIRLRIILLFLGRVITV